LDDALVQILVVVASSQVRRFLTADVRKGFNAIEFSIEWVDLKTSPQWSKGRHNSVCASIGWKGNRLTFLYMMRVHMDIRVCVCLSGYVKVT